MGRLTLKEKDVHFLLDMISREEMGVEFAIDDEEFEAYYRTTLKRISDKLIKALPPK